MCGIVGYFSLKKESIPDAKKQFVKLLENSEVRGVDATGIGCVDGGKLLVMKDKSAAGDFVRKPEVKRFIDSHNPSIMIGHTRFKTKGDESKNDNNHPVYTEDGIAIVHNGSITNDDDIFEKFQLRRKGEVDSEAIVQLIGHFKKKNKTMDAIRKIGKELGGTYAIALIDRAEPDVLYLARRTSPIVLAYNKEKKIIFFASTQKILEQSVYPQKLFHGIFTEEDTSDHVLFATLEDDYIIRIDHKGTTYDQLEERKYEIQAYKWSDKKHPKWMKIEEKSLVYVSDEEIKERLSYLKTWEARLTKEEKREWEYLQKEQRERKIYETN